VAISVDNASTNRKFFIDYLYGGNTFHLMAALYGHTFSRPRHATTYFIDFDPVGLHDLKNVYTTISNLGKNSSVHL